MNGLYGTLIISQYSYKSKILQPLTDMSSNICLFNNEGNSLQKYS